MATRSYVPYLSIESIQTLHGLLESPEMFHDHFNRYTYSTMTQIALGFRTAENHDPKLKQLSKEFDQWSDLIGQSTTVLLDLYPPLRHLPNILLPVKQRAQSQHESMLHLFLEQWHESKQRITLGTSQVRSRRDCWPSIAPLLIC